ncbi:MAG: NAD-dependent epimerase/dehydratase family protein [Thermoproteota archaeon]|nr:NAD-dependent epimerase/dehydratase family protein [Thermoproteota archaeon]
MRTLVLGIDGYIGWALSMHLAKRGHTVSGIDNFSRRANVESIGSQSAIPLRDMQERVNAFRKIHGKNISFFEGDLLDYDFLEDVIKQTRPDSIIHLAEQPSAPFSMIDRSHAIYSQHNNVEGTLNVLYAMKDLVPNCHLVKLGTMGEYGTPNIDIPEGFFEVEYRGRKDILPFPRQPHSMYHLSKVHDTANIMFACRVWKLSSTDIMQGVVYGTRTHEMIEDSLMTRFDFDESFGTVINRYCAEAIIGLPLTPYGEGKQRRGFIDLVDSIQCLTIAVENPAAKGEYRVFNQLDEVYSIAELAEKVVTVAKKLGIDAKIKNVENPRTEKAEHYYKVDHEHLKNLGFKPTRRIEETVEITLKDLMKYRDRILEKSEAILPKTKWYTEPAKHLAEPPSPAIQKG